MEWSYNTLNRWTITHLESTQLVFLPTGHEKEDDVCFQQANCYPVQSCYYLFQH